MLQAWLEWFSYCSWHCIVSYKDHHLKHKKFIITAPNEYKPWMCYRYVRNKQCALQHIHVCIPETPYEMNEPSDAIFNIIHGYCTRDQKVRWCAITHSNVYITHNTHINRHTGNNLPEYKAYLFGMDGFFSFCFVSFLFFSFRRPFVWVHLFVYIHVYVCLWISVPLISLAHETFFSVHLFTCLKFNLDFTWRRANVLILLLFFLSFHYFNSSSLWFFQWVVTYVLFLMHVIVCMYERLCACVYAFSSSLLHTSNQFQF